METTEPNLPQRPVDPLISSLCVTIAGQREQIKALETLAMSRGDDAESYRLLAKQSIEAFHREQTAHTKLRERYERLVVEHRELLRRDTERVAA